LFSGNGGYESISTPRHSLDESWILGVVAQSIAQLSYGAVDSVFVIDPRPGIPESGADLIPRNHFARVLQEEAQDSQRLILNFYQYPLLSEFTGA
jgi:hypothetical protein